MSTLKKRVAVVGTGASGIQTIQELGPKTEELTVYQRTPNMCLPMNQKKPDPAEEEKKKQDGTYEKLINDTRSTFAGFTYDFIDKKTFDDSPEVARNSTTSSWSKRAASDTG